MKPEEFFRIFEGGVSLPLYFFYGDDLYLQSRAVQLFLEHGGGSGRGPDVSVYSAKSTPISAIIDDARTLPFLGNRRLILVKEAEKLFPAGQAELHTYLQNPSRRTNLLLLSQENKISGPILDAFKKNGLVKQLRAPSIQDIPSWVHYLATGLGKSITSTAVALLVDLIGNDLRTLSNEMEKLALFVGGRKDIHQEDIEAVVSPMRIESIFEFTECMGRRKAEKALIALSNLLENGDPPPRILAMINRHFRILLRARVLLEQGGSPEKIRTELNIPSFAWAKVFSQVQKFSRKDLESAFQKLWGTDVALKTRRLSASLFLECLVLDLCQ